MGISELFSGARKFLIALALAALILFPIFYTHFIYTDLQTPKRTWQAEKQYEVETTDLANYDIDAGIARAGRGRRPAGCRPGGPEERSGASRHGRRAGG